MKKQQYCIRRHDTFKTGRYKNNGCKQCIKELGRKQYLKNPRKKLKQTLDWKKKNPKRTIEIRLESQWKRQGILNLKKKLFTYNNYIYLLKKQKLKCAICKRHKRTLKTLLCVDHNHKTGIVRALLCHRCNIVLGTVRDNLNLLRKMKDYLVKYELFRSRSNRL